MIRVEGMATFSVLNERAWASSSVDNISGCFFFKRQFNGAATQDIIENKPRVDSTHTKKRVELCESKWVLYVLEAFSVCLCFTALVRRDSVPEVFPFGCKPAAFLLFQPCAVCIEC